MEISRRSRDENRTSSHVIDREKKKEPLCFPIYFYPWRGFERFQPADPFTSDR